MSLPNKGTNARRLLDYLRHVSARTRESICRGLNDVSRVAIDRIIEDEIEKGNIGKNKAGLRLTSTALKLLTIEDESFQTARTDNFKPLHQSRFINVRGNREGSNDLSRDVIGSKHY